MMWTEKIIEEKREILRHQRDAQLTIKLTTPVAEWIHRNEIPINFKLAPGQVTTFLGMPVTIDENVKDFVIEKI